MPDAAVGRIVDMRSDTVTHPTAEMREAMKNAQVGDDVFGDDPTVNALQVAAAARFGKEAALWVPTGTMGNLICLMVHCELRSSEVILGSLNHIYLWEQGGLAAVGGINPRVLPTQPDGTMLLEDIENAIRAVNDHFPITRLVALEQTHNQTGGRVLPLSYIDDVAAICKRRGLKLHIDGARIFNACASIDVAPERMVRDADTVSVCLSKGLASPCGSIILGTAEFIRKARRVRKVLGGGLRQVGVVAACGLLSLEKMSLPDRLKEDHRRAKAIAAGLGALQGLQVSEADTQSNLVMVHVTEDGISAQDLIDNLKERGTLVVSPKPGSIRVSLHYQIDDECVAKAVADFAAALDELRSSATAKKRRTGDA